MDQSLAAARVAFLLSCVVFAWAWPRPAPETSNCDRPVLVGPAEIACVRGDAEVPRLDGPVRRLFGLPIDPNRAEQLALETLPGIGPARARAILAERENQPFETLQDLQRVPGLGPVRVAALAPFVGFEGRLAVEIESSVKSPSCRSCCGRAGGVPPVEQVPPCEEDR